MSMSTSIVGIKPPDETWKKMKAAWDACEAAGVEPPEEIWNFFDGEAPDEKGVIIDLDDHYHGQKPIAKEWSKDGSSGFEVNLDDLPKDVKIIRFYNSW